MLQEALAVEQRVLSPEHPSTLGSTSSLSCCLAERGYEAAADMARQALRARQRVLGPEHSATLERK